jgi:hypothetical protein
MNDGLLIAIAMTFVCGWFVTEGLMTGTLVALPVRFARNRQPYGYWFCISFFVFMAAIFWLAWAVESGIL